MTSAPDGLPRSPTGRVPQWVVDESAGRPAAATGWPAPPPTGTRRPRRRRRRGSGPVMALLVVAAVVVAWWATGGVERLERGTWPGTAPAASVPPPSAELVAIAGEAYLSEEGRSLLYAARPVFLDAAA